MHFNKMIVTLVSTTLLTLVMGGGCGEDLTPRSSLKEAMEDYQVCIEEGPNTSCEEEEAHLVSQMPEVSYRKAAASVMAKCGNGSSVTCSGYSCAGIDGTGCLCKNSGGSITSLELCP